MWSYKDLGKSHGPYPSTGLPGEQKETKLYPHKGNFTLTRSIAGESSVCMDHFDHSTDPGQNQASPGEGAWIFLSHSNKDFEQVREIRNQLEQRGHRPLMFFLKCLEVDDARLPDLLRQEIVARQWFILCDSPSARASKWVQEEVAMIESMSGKVVQKIDLSKGWETQIHKLIELSKRATVFLSYARRDELLVRKIRNAFARHDYRVWSDESIAPGEEWASAVVSAIDDAVSKGFVLVLLSPASLASEHCRREVAYAFQSASRSIVPVIIAPFAPEDVPDSLRYFLPVRPFDLTTGPFDERVEELIRDLKKRDMG